MVLKEIIDKYPEQYIAVAHVKKGIDNIIQTAAILKVYPTLQDAYQNIREIKTFIKDMMILILYMVITMTMFRQDAG